MIPYDWKHKMEFSRKQFWITKGVMFFFIIAFLYLAFDRAIMFGYNIAERKYSNTPVITYYQEGIPVCTDTAGNVYFVTKRANSFLITGSAIRK